MRLYKNFEGVGRFAFISPFPKWVLSDISKEDLEIFRDTKEFDRRDIIREINSDIAAFFGAHL